MSQNRSKIPVCRSQYLQDLTIALGRRSLKGLRYANPILKFETSQENVEGAIHERLDIEARTQTGKLTKLTLWDDAIAWIYVGTPKSKVSQRESFEAHASLAKMNDAEAAQLLRSTLVDFESVRKVWERFRL